MGIFRKPVVSIGCFAVLACAVILLFPGTGESGHHIKSSNTKKRTYHSKRSGRYNDIALLFSGKDIPKGSRLYRFSRGAYYTRYKKRLFHGWNKFQRKNIIKIKRWWKKYRPQSSSSKIMYPFSGPDILNALAFFPDGSMYIMFGLEKPGIIPRLDNLTDKQIEAGLNGLLNSTGFIMRHNFFRTKGMAKKLGSKSFSGITGLIMLFLSLDGQEVMDIRKIAIDSKSRISPWIKSDDKIDWLKPPKSKRIPGVEITFRKGNGPRRKIRYFMLNVINWSLAKNSTNFVPYLKKEGRFSTVIKSASYLMHARKFSRIKDAVMSNSDYIVQDASGIPISLMPKENWKFGFHGYYYNPIKLWEHRKQYDLRKEMKKNSSGVLPFSYGYQVVKGKSCLITSERIKK